jgi:hypothetical protein
MFDDVEGIAGFIALCRREPPPSADEIEACISKLPAQDQLTLSLHMYLRFAELASIAGSGKALH